MSKKFIYKRFFAITDSNEQYFNTEFKSGLNIVHGKNTSGKSTLIQAIQYTFGINSEKNKLEEILNENMIFRIDFELSAEGEDSELISVIRQNELLIVKREESPLIRFNGISADNSNEHIKLKSYFGRLFDFSLNLENSKGGYSQGAIEAAFLPYYIAQDVGWIYKHKSFRGLDFIRNFKNDYLDYYLGVLPEGDRIEKRALEEKKALYENEIKFLTKIEAKDEQLNLSKLMDEKFTKKSVEYLAPYKDNKADIIELEKSYLLECNKLAFLEQRKKILQKIKRSIKKQNPVEGHCPTCNQNLQNSIEEVYNHYQDLNDTDAQISEINQSIETIKESQSKINSLSNKIVLKQKLIAQDYSLLSNYTAENLTFVSWLDNKANVQLSKNIESQLGMLTKELAAVVDGLKLYVTEEDTKKARKERESDFKIYFKQNLKELDVKMFEDPRYLNLYKTPEFPKQGVELLKTQLAYSFAFSKVISKTSYVHRLPFLMDAVFEGDFERDNKILILKFLNKHHQINHQTIVSIADTKNNDVSVIEYNRSYFNKSANLICIGDNDSERAFLSPYVDQHDEYIKELYLYLD